MDRLPGEKVYEEGRFEVFTVVERNNKSWWTKLGRGYLNKDASINLFLDALPANGKLQVRREEKREERMPPARIDAAGDLPPPRGFLAGSRGSLP
ncbi:MAG: hypothetical protein IT381_19295 [Deltaproteobacteria bacterium]|nr:hypothetical protein [Deltaproteobacteria bacterium]